MKNSKKIKMFSAFVFADILLLGSLLFVYDSVFENELKDSISSVVNLKNDYDDNFILGKKNNDILKSIDNYFNNCSYMNDILFTDSEKEQLLDIISYQSLAKDYPNFDNSIELLNKIENDVNSKYANLDEKLNVIALREYIYSIYNHSKYVNNYNKIVKNNDINNKLLSIKNEADSNVKNARNYFTKIREVLLFLKNHNNQYSINSNQIVFYDNDLNNSFNYMISNIK